MEKGTVKWYNETKGYGFITPENGSQDVFVHVTAVQAANMNRLSEGQEIFYEISENNGKKSAVNLKAA
ncbi:MAG: CspA family cold shock protein [Alphaproteobacteria bacterium]|jgi:CspA family cold shock protein